MKNFPFKLFKKGLAGAISLSFFIVNGPLAYSGETSFWNARRVASEQVRRTNGEGFNSGSSNGQMLLAQLPKAGPLDLGRPDNTSTSADHTSPKEPFVLGPKTGDWLGKRVSPYGSVREVYLSPDTKAPFIVHIQDAHGIEEAQRNISSMIGQLAQEPGISLVGLEAAFGSFSLEEYRDYPDASITKDIADLFLKKGLIAGPEYAGLTLPKSPDFFGAEDKALYSANVQALKDAYKGKQVAQESLAALQRASAKLKETYFSPDLKTFDRHFEAYHSEKEKLATYVRYLLSTHQSLENMKAVPNVGLLVKALEEENSLDFKRVEEDRRQLVERLVGKLSAAQMQDLVAKSVDYRAGRMGYGDYHNHLKRICLTHGVKFNQWPQLSRYLDYVLLADKIDRNELLNEMERLDRAIPERLARNEKERQLVAVAFDLSLLAKLIRHEMSVADWTAYESRMGEIHRLAARLTALDASVKVKGLTAETLKPYEDFCSYAARRNNALTDNLLRQMADTKGKSAVLVAGGFHTEGLSALLRQKQVSYVVVTPKISSIPKDNDYLDVMANDPLPLEKQLAGDRIYLAKAIEMANPEGLSARTMAGLQKVAQLGEEMVSIGKRYALTTDSQYTGATVVFHLNSNTPVYLVTNYSGKGFFSNLVPATGKWIVDISKRIMGEDSTRVEDALLVGTAVVSVAFASTGLPVVGAALFAFSHMWKNLAPDLINSGSVPEGTANTPVAVFKANPVATVAYTTILFGAAFALLEIALFVLGVPIPVSVDSTLAPFMVSEATQTFAQTLSLQNVLATFLSVRLIHKAWNNVLGGKIVKGIVVPKLTLQSKRTHWEIFLNGLTNEASYLDLPGNDPEKLLWKKRIIPNLFSGEGDETHGVAINRIPEETEIFNNPQNFNYSRHPNFNNKDLVVTPVEKGIVGNLIAPILGVSSDFNKWFDRLMDDVFRAPLREADDIISKDLQEFRDGHAWRDGGVVTRGLGWMGMGVIASVSLALMAAAPFTVLLSFGLSQQMATIISLGIAGWGAVLSPDWVKGSTFIAHVAQNALARLVSPALQILGLPRIPVWNSGNILAEDRRSNSSDSNNIQLVINALSSSNDEYILRIHLELMATFERYRKVTENQVKTNSISSITSFWLSHPESFIGNPSGTYRRGIITGVMNKVSESNSMIKFESLSVSDSGGFGDIWFAKIDNKPVVIKAVRFEDSPTVLEEAILRIASVLLEEKHLEKLGQLTQSGITPRLAPRLIGKGTLDLGHNVIIMERIEGTPKLIEGNGLSLKDAVNYWKALADLHELGYVHGDIKPANIIPLESEAILIDLGSAKEEAEGYSLGDVTLSQWYAAPEAPNGSIRSSDVYAMAGTMIDLLPIGISTRDDIYPHLLRAIKGIPSPGSNDESMTSLNFRPTAKEMFEFFLLASKNQYHKETDIESDVKMRELQRLRTLNRNLILASERNKAMKNLYRKNAPHFNNIIVYILGLFFRKDVAISWGMRLLPIEIAGLVTFGWVAGALVDPLGLSVGLMVGGLALFKGLHYVLGYIQYALGRGEKPVLSVSGFARELSYFLPYVALPFLASNAVLFAAGALVSAYLHYSYDSKLLKAEKTAGAIVDKINATTDPTEKMALNAVVGDLMMKGRVSDLNLKLVSGGSAYWTQQDLVQTLMGYGDGQAAEALQSSEAKFNALIVLAKMMVQEGQGPGVRMTLDLMNFTSWEKEVQETAKTMIAGLTKAGQPILILHGTGDTNTVLGELGLTLNPAQMDLIDTQEADPGISMRQVVLDYNARTSGKGVPLASKVLVQSDQSILMDLNGFQIQKYSDLSKAIQNAIDTMIAVLQSA